MTRLYPKATMKQLIIFLALISTTQGKAMNIERIVKEPVIYDLMLASGPQNLETSFFNLKDDCELPSGIAGAALLLAKLNSIKSPNSFDVYRYLRLAAYGETALFQQVKIGPEKEIEIYLGEGPKVVHKGLTPRSYTDALSWQHAFFLIAASNEWHLLDTFVSISDSMENSGKTIVPKEISLFNKALRGYWLGDKNTPQYTLDALAEANPDKYTDKDFKNSALYSISPKVDLLFNIMVGEKEAFNKSLEKAINSRKKLIEINNNPEDNPLMLSILGLVALAYRRGIEITVESDYIPKTIYSGAFTPSLYTCPYCVSPLPNETTPCPHCGEDTSDDSFLKMDFNHYMEMKTKECPHCKAEMKAQAIKCTSCKKWETPRE